MKLFTKEVDKQLFAQYPKGSDLENQMVVAKIFNPYGRGVWYLLNSDPEDPDYIWAIVDLFEPEMGSVSRSELQTVKVPPFGLGLERDIYFTPKPAKEVFEGVLRGERYDRGGSIASQNKDMLENQTANIMHHAKELHEAVKNTNIEIMPWVLTKIQRATTDLQDVSHYLEGEEAKFAAGGMTAGRWYKDRNGKEFRYIGESQGKLLFNDGEKIIEKDEEDFEEEKKEKKLFGLFADGGRVKGRNNETGETYGVVIGSVKKADEFDGGGIQMNVRSGYGSRISESTLYFDNDGNLLSITDYGYGLEGNYPETSGGSGTGYNADKKETLQVLSKKYNPAFAKKLIELAKDSKMADGGETAAAEHNIKQAKYGAKLAKGGGIYSSDSLYYLQVLKDGEEVGREKFRAKNLREAKEIAEDDYEQKYINKHGNPLNFIVSEAMAKGGKLIGKQKKLDLNKNGKLDAEDFKMLRKGKMAMGGKVKFEDKVKAIKASLLKRKKVSPKVQKDYGKTYSPKEAEESAKRIVGAQTAKYELKKK